MDATPKATPLKPRLLKICQEVYLVEYAVRLSPSHCIFEHAVLRNNIARIFASSGQED